jgi:predicted ribosome quality control (RQC) complex YloA/Tae2 family protein
VLVNQRHTLYVLRDCTAAPKRKITNKERFVMRNPEIQPDCWNYQLDGGWEVLAGKTDADNDLLSLKLARANDLWFHVRSLPGSHVILRHPEGGKPDNATIRQAAAIAAWHSKARQGGTVPVACTEAKHVGKPRGAKPGSVSIKRERVIKVRPALPDA